MIFQLCVNFFLNLFLFFILAFYFSLFFIRLNPKNSKFKYLFNNRSFNINSCSELWLFIIDKCGSNFIELEINLTMRCIHLNLNNYIINDKVLRGKSGFLFYILEGDGDNKSDFFKENLVSQQQLENSSKKVKEIMDLCTYLNTSFLLIIGPNKHSVYPEFYPVERPPGKTRTDQLSQVFNALNLSFIFPRDYLIQQKKISKFPLYYETDTHWNSMGAFYTSLLIKQRIQEFFPHISFPEISYQFTATKKCGTGDLINMLGQNSSLRSEFNTIVTITPQNVSNPLYLFQRKEGRDFITIGANKSLPKALIYCDSFFVALHPFVSPLFSQAEYLWRKFDKERLLQIKPDLLIFELVERYSHYFYKY